MINQWPDQVNSTSAFTTASIPEATDQGSMQSRGISPLLESYIRTPPSSTERLMFGDHQTAQSRIAEKKAEISTLLDLCGRVLNS